METRARKRERDQKYKVRRNRKRTRKREFKLIRKVVRGTEEKKKPALIIPAFLRGFSVQIALIVSRLQGCLS